MKNSLLPLLLLIGSGTLSAQRPGTALQSFDMGSVPFSSENRAVTDTLAPGSWADDPNTQLTLWGALCGDVGSEFPCGYILGNNGYGDKAKAQQFLLSDPPTTLVEGILFWFYAKDGSPDAIVHARLYAIDGEGTTTTGTAANIAPGTVLASTDFTLSEVDTTESDGFTMALFDEPVYVNTQFAAGFDVSSLGDTDSLGLIGTSSGTTDFSEFSWEKWDTDDWVTLKEAWGDDLDIDLCLFVLLDNSSVGIDDEGSLNHLRMSFLNGNITNGPVRIAYDVVEQGAIALVVVNSKGGVVTLHSFGVQGTGRHVYELNTTDWAAGTYFVTLMNDGRPLTKKLIVY